MTTHINVASWKLSENISDYKKSLIRRLELFNEV